MSSVEEGGTEYRPEDKQGTHWPVTQEDEDMIERIRSSADKAVRLERRATGIPFLLDLLAAAETGPCTGVCYCGTEMSEHTDWENHSPVEMPSEQT